MYSSVCMLILCFLSFFFFKQKTAYEMRISDWSSDVCSSDLPARPLLVADRDHVIGEDAPECGVRDRRRAVLVRRRMGMRKPGKGGYGHGQNHVCQGEAIRASLQSRAPGATVVLMSGDTLRSQVPAAVALFLHSAYVRRGIEYLFF